MDEPIRPKSSSVTKTVPKHDTKKRDVKSSTKSVRDKSSKDPRDAKVREKEPRKEEKREDKKEPRKDEKKEDSRREEPREKREERREEPREKREERREESREKREERREEPQKEETQSKQSRIRVVSDVKSYLEYRDDGLVVVDFNTSWCGPCREFGPTFAEIANNYPGVTFLSVDAESFEHEDTTSVKSVPTFKVFLNGVLRREFSGVKEAREKLERYIERYQIQILINGRTQRAFPQNVKDKVSKYMDMFQPE